MTRNLDVPDEYAALYRVYEDAYEQASEGKGKERHASDGEAYEDQIICEVARRVGLGYPLGQAAKKIYESQRIGGERGVAELLGALNYIAAAVIVMREGLEAAPKAESGCCQNGNGHSPEASAEPEFQRGDKVEAQMVPDSSTWASAVITAVYRDKDSCEWRYCVDFEDDWTHVVVPSARVRPVSGIKAEGCEELVQEEPEPEFNPRDRVQAKMGDGKWRDAFVSGKEIVSGKLHYTVSIHGFDGYYSLPAEDIRPAPRAEGCEALVEKDAPQTKEELMQRIVDSNPANYKPRNLWEGLTRLNIKPTFEPHKATGEELAEMAEEERA